MSADTPRFTVEEVDAVNPPRRAHVDDIPEPAPEAAPVETAGERKRDYLSGFLAEKPQGVNPGEPGGEIYEGVVAALRDIFDPEIPVNIYDLGLIYGVDVAEDGHVAVTMTLTTPHCPVAESMPGEVELRVSAVPGVRDAEVNLVWDPPWDPQKMSDDAKLELGML
ncbi:FeS assembly SUF system protein [Novosphingobium capsulatum]|uniref:FeS assembly SUF system protein n=1 Tax=Novosphingobium capsulatum TaxID=13688 RepID=A0ABU1MKI4_9SPHN|nr:MULTISPECIES: SUF system Fe-S cluster assembly protein [Novosphingobium]KPF54244.1 FeS assembly SUF system protein [Novosphingobium sp. AAP1]MBB3359113.1 FeS assembly SUF system protein [Novosphingobium sp. BK256]MBB3375406.1 FeS assembly SUF system protein [Novosphingobium sp. BK280]MBB3379885.1 FeS assembly SUF system protein [Novosphingobium sp. BK258]MBB3421580.1 FeS assembly SUF system protein [Novosphingobium sp. BK267]